MNGDTSKLMTRPVGRVLPPSCPGLSDAWFVGRSWSLATAACVPRM